MMKFGATEGHATVLQLLVSCCSSRSTLEAFYDTNRVERVGKKILSRRNKRIILFSLIREV